MQGELTNSVQANNFTFAPFNPDGTINFEAGQVLFDIVWNRPGDYNFETGLMDTNQQTRNADGSLALLQPQAHTVWVAQTVTSTFSQGKFEQELQGSAYLNNAYAAAENEQIARAKAKVTAETEATATPRTPSRDFDAGDLPTTDNSTNPNPVVQAAVGPVVTQNLQPQSQAEPPVSNGDITPSTDVPAPPKIDVNSPIQANTDEVAAVKAYTDAGGTFPRGTGPITSGPLYDAVLSAKNSLAARQQAYSSANSTPPQDMAPKDA